jgi:hypothetical protein
MHLIVDKIYNARRVIGEGEDVERHYQELAAYLREEVHPKGFKFEQRGNELIVIGYCGDFVEGD